jgi:hypothetical protein
MNAKLLSPHPMALLDRALRILPHIAANYYAIWHDLQPNRVITRLVWHLPPDTPENSIGNVSREHVKHKYKRPGCRI